MANIRSLNIVLLGHTGHGKSATGNTILGRAHFPEDYAPTSITQMIYEGKTTYNDLEVHVYDTPGNFDSATNNSSVKSYIPIAIENMNMLMRGISVRGGVSAFFLVYSYPIKFTSQEINAIEIIEKIFGDTVFSQHGVLVFTHGENVTFDLDTWCGTQSEKLISLIQKFRQRVIIICNKSDDAHDKQSSRFQMIELAKDIHANGTNLYSNENYDQAARSRELLLFYENLNNIKDDINNKIINLRDEVNGKRQISHVDKRRLNEEIAVIRFQIDQGRKGTNELDMYSDQLDQVERNMRRKISSCVVS